MHCPPLKHPVNAAFGSQSDGIAEEEEEIGSIEDDDETAAAEEDETTGVWDFGRSPIPNPTPNPTAMTITIMRKMGPQGVEEVAVAVWIEALDGAE